MKKFFKIGEISKLYGIGVDSIRYYEEIGIIKPERSESGYRHYSIHDIWRLNVIRDLRSIGFTMEQIREYLEHHTVSSSLSMLEDEKEAITKQMQHLQKLQKNVEHRLNTIHSAFSLPLDEIHLMTLPPLRRIQTRRRNGFSDETTYHLKSKSIVYHWQQSNGNYDFAPLSTKEKNTFLSICFSY